MYYSTENHNEYIAEVTRIFTRWEPSVDTEIVEYEVSELWKEGHNPSTTSAKDAAQIIADKVWEVLEENER